MATVAARVAEAFGRKTLSLTPDDLALSFSSASNTRVTIFEVSNRAPLDVH